MAVRRFSLPSLPQFPFSKESYWIFVEQCCSRNLERRYVCIKCRYKKSEDLFIIQEGMP